MNPSNKIEYTQGQKIGSCLFIKEEPARKWTRFATFQCIECGNIFITKIQSVSTGATKSCGCIWKRNIKESVLKHGMGGTKTYKSWWSMVNRCTNPEYKKYCDYGGRGIKVCKEWVNSFEKFHSDMGDRPQNTSLERIKNHIGYNKNNCKWADKVEQANNKRNNVRIEYNGEIHTIAEWARKLNLNYGSFCKRLKYPNWSTERAFQESINKKQCPKDQ